MKPGGKVIGGVTALAMALATLIAPAAASAWSAPQKISSSAPVSSGLQDNTIIAGSTYVLPNGHFAALSTAGLSTGAAGGTFTPPAPWPSTPNGSFPIKAVFRSDGSATVAYGGFAAVDVYDRSASGTFTGPLGPYYGSEGYDLRSDGRGGLIGVYGEDAGSAYQLYLITRPAGATSFTQKLVTTDSGVTWPTLVMDPNGTVVLLWMDSGNIMQAVRPAGQASFGKPSPLQTGGEGGTNQTLWPMPSVAQNASGKAVTVFYNQTIDKWMAAIRQPGSGGFSAPTTLPDQQPQDEMHNFMASPPSAAAVAQSGNMAVATTDTITKACSGGSGNGFYVGQMNVFTVGAGSTTWSKPTSYGGAAGNSAGNPVLAGGPGAEIQAAWWKDPGTEEELCTAPGTRSVTLMAGALASPSPLATFQLLEPTNWTGASSPYNRPQSSPVVMTLDGCGHGAMEFGWNPSTSAYPAPAGQDGIYVSTLGSGACQKATAPKNTTRPAVGGTPKVGKTVTCSKGAWSGTAPLSYTYGWLRDGKAIAGAAGASFHVVSADRGQSLACRVTAHNRAGSASAVSPAVRVSKS